MINYALFHDRERRLAQHVANWVIREDQRGASLPKPDTNLPRRTDAAVAAVMAFDRVCYLADTSEPQLFMFVVTTPKP